MDRVPILARGVEGQLAEGRDRGLAVRRDLLAHLLPLLVEKREGEPLPFPDGPAVDRLLNLQLGLRALDLGIRVGEDGGFCLVAIVGHGRLQRTVAVVGHGDLDVVHGFVIGNPGGRALDLGQGVLVCARRIVGDGVEDHRAVGGVGLGLQDAAVLALQLEGELPLGKVGALEHLFGGEGRAGRAQGGRAFLLVEHGEGGAGVGMDAQCLGLRKLRGIVDLVLVAGAAEHHVRRLGIADLVASGRLGLLVAVQGVRIQGMLFVAELHDAVRVGRLGVIADGIHLRLLHVAFCGSGKIDFIQRELGSLQGFDTGFVGFDDGKAVAGGACAGVGFVNAPLLRMTRRCSGKALHLNGVVDLHLRTDGPLRRNIVAHRQRLGVGNGQREHGGGAAVFVRFVFQRIRNAFGDLFALGIGDRQGPVGEGGAGAQRVDQGERIGGADLQGIRVHLDGIGHVRAVASVSGLLVQHLVRNRRLARARRELLIAGGGLRGVGELLGFTRLDGRRLDRGLVGELHITLPRAIFLGHAGGRNGEGGGAAVDGRLRLELRPVAGRAVTIVPVQPVPRRSRDVGQAVAQRILDRNFRTL